MGIVPTLAALQNSYLGSLQLVQVLFVCFLLGQAISPYPQHAKNTRATLILLGSHLLPPVVMLLTAASPLLQASLVTSFFPRQHFLCVNSIILTAIVYPPQLSPPSCPCNPSLLWDLAPSRRFTANFSAAASSKYIKHFLWYLCNHTPHAFQELSPSAGRCHWAHGIWMCLGLHGCRLWPVLDSTPAALQTQSLSQVCIHLSQKTTCSLKNYFFHCKIQWSRYFLFGCFSS